MIIESIHETHYDDMGKRNFEAITYAALYAMNEIPLQQLDIMVDQSLDHVYEKLGEVEIPFRDSKVLVDFNTISKSNIKASISNYIRNIRTAFPRMDFGILDGHEKGSLVTALLVGLHSGWYTEQIAPFVLESIPRYSKLESGSDQDKEMLNDAEQLAIHWIPLVTLSLKNIECEVLKIVMGNSISIIDDQSNQPRALSQIEVKELTSLIAGSNKLS